MGEPRRPFAQHGGEYPEQEGKPEDWATLKVFISSGGPSKRNEKGWQSPVTVGGRATDQVPGWNYGDIDFKEDGTIFIRNPYLADAIETFLMRNWEEMQRTEGRGKVKHFLRITRDEGWSGHPTNIVC